MIRFIACVSIVSLLIVAPSPALLAQFGHSMDRQIKARLRRAAMENAIGFVGPEARDLVEAYGDSAVHAISACSKPVALKLARFHNSGALGNFPRPHELLKAIGEPRNGDDVALWAIEHAGELADRDCCAAFLADPLEYALNLKSIQQGTAEARAARLNPAPPSQTTTVPFEANLKSILESDRLGFACFVGLVVLIVLARWKKRQSGN